MMSPHELGHDRRAGVTVRILGHTCAAVGAAMRGPRDEVRPALVGVPAPGLRES